MGESEELPENKAGEGRVATDRDTLNRVGALINRLKDNSNLDEVDMGEIKQFNNEFPNEYSAKKIQELLEVKNQAERKKTQTLDEELPTEAIQEEETAPEEEVELEGEPDVPDEDTPQSLEDLGIATDNDLTDEQQTADEIIPEETIEVDDLENNEDEEIEEELYKANSQQAVKENTNGLEHIDDIDFNIPTIQEGQDVKENTPPQTPPPPPTGTPSNDEPVVGTEEASGNSTETDIPTDEEVIVDESRLEPETVQSTTENAPASDQDFDEESAPVGTTEDLESEESAPQSIDTEFDDNNDENQDDDRPPEEKFSLENLVGDDLDEDLNEQNLVEKYTLDIPHTTLIEDNYQKALLLINRFEPDNRDLLLKAIKENQLNESQLESIFEDIIDKKNETRIIEKVSNFLLNHDEYYEILERRNKILDAEKRVFQKVFRKATFNYQIKQLFFLTLFGIIIFLTVFFGYDHLRAYRLYNKSYEAIANGKNKLGEEYFKLASQRKVHISRFLEIGELYLNMGLDQPAQNKFETALQYKPDSLDAKIGYGKFLLYSKNFNRSDQILLNARKRGTYEKKLEESIGENYIEWGKENSQYFTKAHRIFTDMIKRYPNDSLLYLAKKMEIYSLEFDYFKSKFYYQLINKQNPNYKPLKPYITYFDFLLKTYRNKDIHGDPIINQNVLEKHEDQYIIKTLDHNLNDLITRYPDKPVVKYYFSKWLKATGRNDQAKRILEEGVKLSKVHRSYYFSKDKAYSLLGIYQYDDGDTTIAEETFAKSLSINSNNSEANYYMGKIYLEQDRDLVGAKEYLLTAFENWNKNYAPEKVDLIYSLGFLNYITGKDSNDPEIKEARFNNALHYWSMISDKVTDRTEYLIDFCIALSYLQLKKYDLAEVYLQIHMEDLKSTYPLYVENQEKTLREIKDRLYILSDLYNNLGVTHIEKYLINEDKNPTLLQNGLENFINSISLKDKMGLVKGIPYVNFNTVNSLPKRIKQENSQYERFFEQRKLIISDEFVPPSILNNL